MEAKWPQGEECRRHYFDLLNYQLSKLFPGFIRNLQIQSPQEREMGRAAVLEYSKEEYSDHKVFHGSDELQDYFEQTSVHQPQNPQQRLFLLEDLSRNYVEVLGSQLRIPPSFFGAHWNDPTAAAFNHRNPFRQFSENGFLIRYPSDQPVQIAECGEGSNTYSWNANVNRNLYCYDPKGPLTEYPKSYHILSFWTTGVRDDGSWDSVLLVDPPIGSFVKAPTTGKLVKVNHHLQYQSSNQMEDLHPDFSTFHILPQNMSQWSDVWRCPQYDSIFDDALFLNQVSQQRIDNPRASTAITRKLVISVFLAFLRCRCLNMLRRQAGLQADLSRINRCDYLRDFAGGMLGRWQQDLFGFNVNVKHRMNVLVKEVEENMVALGLDHNGIIPGVTIPTWERDGWRAIHASCTTILNMTEMLLQSYLQFISIEEAQLSNKNARSLARITHLTLIFIPLSTIAAILSMGEDFLPGKRKGWVFWAIAFPVLLLMLVYTKESRQWIRQLWANRRNLLQRSWKGIF